MSAMSYMYGMRDMKVPCQNCKSREVGCHAACEKYMTFKEERAEQKKKVAEYRKEHTKLRVNKDYMHDSTFRDRGERSYLNVLNANKRAERGE